MDFEFDECSGQIKKLIVPSCSMFSLCFHCEPDYEICYKDIKQIGPDIILVDKCWFYAEMSRFGLHKWKGNNWQVGLHNV